MSILPGSLSSRHLQALEISKIFTSGRDTVIAQDRVLRELEVAHLLIIKLAPPRALRCGEASLEKPQRSRIQMLFTIEEGFEGIVPDMRMVLQEIIHWCAHSSNDCRPTCLQEEVAQSSVHTFLQIR